MNSGLLELIDTRASELVETRWFYHEAGTLNGYVTFVVVVVVVCVAGCFGNCLIADIRGQQRAGCRRRGGVRCGDVSGGEALFGAARHLILAAASRANTAIEHYRHQTNQGCFKVFD